jgi:hypothetical protein
MRQARTSPELPTHGGDRTHIVVTRNYHDLRTGIGTACLDVVGDITAAETRLLARDCWGIPMVLPIHDESKGTYGAPSRFPTRQRSSQPI